MILHGDTFDVFVRKQKKFVKLKKKRKGQRSCTGKSSHPECIEVSTSAELCSGENIGNEESSTGSEFDDRFSVEGVSNERQEPQDETLSGIDVTESMGLQADFDLKQFIDLVGKGESETVKFVSSFSEYISDPEMFSLDIVSMWNTPHRITAYILTGVTNKSELLGETVQTNQKSISNLFQSAVFTYTPVYKLHIVKYESKLFYVVSINTSFGFANPCVTKMTDSDSPQTFMQPDQLWTRQGTKNVVCKQSSLESGLIYQWFLGSKHARQSARVTEQKNVFTSTDSAECTTAVTEHGHMVSCTQHGESFEFFVDIVKKFNNGHFALITGNVNCSVKHVSAFGRIPWLSVYDFDIFSKSYGLYNVVQEVLGNKRHLKSYCWNDAPENITERGTRWCFMRGCREFSASRTDRKDEEIEELNIWFKHVKKSVDIACEKLANFVEDYTVLNIIFLLPEEELLVPFMIKFLYRLTDALTNSPNIVLCMSKPKPTTRSGTVRYEAFCQDYVDNLKVCYLPFESFCLELEKFVTAKEDKQTRYRLPNKENTDISSDNLDLTEKEAAWLGEELDVLYLDNPYTFSATTEEEVVREITNFYKGGTLPWYMWYNNMAETAVIDRTVQKQLESNLRHHLADFKTSTVTLFHAPGSGGTTLAQKVLWNLHRDFPSVNLKLRSNVGIDELDRKMMFLYERTGLPIVLLVDAKEESKLRQLSRRLKYTVILCVKRHPYKTPSDSRSKTDCVYLSGYVTKTECKELEARFAEKCEDGQKKSSLSNLTRDVLSEKHHCLYEYGMTVYLHEFKGIVSYVHGYLELKNNLTQQLTPVQKCLGYLALVYYYGQTSVPCHFFSPLLCQPSGVGLTLEKMPAPIEQFVVYDKNESRKNNIRICHYIVAKEILEQILSRNLKATRTDTLGVQACRNLSEFCIGFIEYAGDKRTKSSSAVAIKFVLTKTFIFRDERDMSDNAEQIRRKPVLSRVMIDIPAGLPLFTDRLNVLRKLVQVFPDDPNFIAHLGRFYAFCRPEEEQTAEECFKKAVKLCEDKICGKTQEYIDDWLKLAMMHIYHMYGIVKQRYVAKYTGRSQTEKVVAFDAPDIFNERIKDIVPVAQEACEYFTKSRDVTPENHDVYTYTYTGEIQVRLQVCDFVMRHFKGHNQNRIKQFLESTVSPASKDFVWESIATVEKLILECYSDVDLIKSERESLQKLVIWYNTIFKDQVLCPKGFAFKDKISERRLKIAEKKLKFGRRECLSGVETIENEDVINEIVSLYEDNFADVRVHGFQPYYEKRDLERDFRDWIYAIRQEYVTKDYDLEEVLSKIQFWNEKVMSPISSFYVFIIYSLLGFGVGTKPGKTECLIEAWQRREALIRMNHLVIRPKYPREWLGNTGNGIKRLKIGFRNIGICTEDRDSTSGSRGDLQICKGSICPPNTNHVNGMISLDLGVNGPDVRVYYIPKVPNLSGGRFAGQRVEFNLAFTIQHGYEAYNVKLLKMHVCSACSRNVELTSAETTLKCICGVEIHKDDMNEVKYN